jgi:hypothetical protein
MFAEALLALDCSIQSATGPARRWKHSTRSATSKQNPAGALSEDQPMSCAE